VLVAPLIVLIVATLLARLVGQFGVASLRSWQAATRVGVAVMLCFTAVAHFNDMRADLVRMVPPGVPNPELMVTLTGICEVLGGIGLLVTRTRRVAAALLIVFLIAVLPANIHAARGGLTIGGATATPLWPRVALQLLFIGLVWWTGWRRTDTAVLKTEPELGGALR
jgi:uncharacterized membrane protein